MKWLIGFAACVVAFFAGVVADDYLPRPLENGEIIAKYRTEHGCGWVVRMEDGEHRLWRCSPENYELSEVGQGVTL